MYFFNRISIIMKFLFDKKIPLKEKWWIIIPAIYILSPIDLIPAPILVFGFIDDFVIFMFLLSLAKSKTKKYYDTEHNEDIDKEKIIENVQYEVKGDEEED